MPTNKIYFLNWVHENSRKGEKGCCGAGHGRGIKIAKFLKLKYTSGFACMGREEDRNRSPL
jgi:hypothetical protein